MTPDTMPKTRCPPCGKEVRLTSTGTMRPHNVPIEVRTDGRAERCVGSGRKPESLGGAAA